MVSARKGVGVRRASCALVTGIVCTLTVLPGCMQPSPGGVDCVDQMGGWVHEREIPFEPARLVPTGDGPVVAWVRPGSLEVFSYDHSGELRWGNRFDDTRPQGPPDLSGLQDPLPVAAAVGDVLLLERSRGTTASTLLALDMATGEVLHEHEIQPRQWLIIGNDRIVLLPAGVSAPEGHTVALLDLHKGQGTARDLHAGGHYPFLQFADQQAIFVQVGASLTKLDVPGLTQAWTRPLAESRVIGVREAGAVLLAGDSFSLLSYDDGTTAWTANSPWAAGDRPFLAFGSKSDVGMVSKNGTVSRWDAQFGAASWSHTVPGRPAIVEEGVDLGYRDYAMVMEWPAGAITVWSPTGFDGQAVAASTFVTLNRSTGALQGEASGAWPSPPYPSDAGLLALRVDGTLDILAGNGAVERSCLLSHQPLAGGYRSNDHWLYALTDTELIAVSLTIAK